MNNKIVETIVDCDDLYYEMWKGTRFKLEREVIGNYEGYWIYDSGMYYVSIPKERCICLI